MALNYFIVGVDVNRKHLEAPILPNSPSAPSFRIGFSSGAIKKAGLAGRFRQGKNQIKSLIIMVSASLVFAVSGCQQHFVDHSAKLPEPVPVHLAGNAASTTNGATISIDRAIELILKVPEVKEWSEAVQKAGRHPAFMIDDKVETVDGHDYLSVNVYEDAGEYLTRYGTFLVEVDGKDVILVADDPGENDESPYLSLEQWREQRNRPASERGSEGDAP